MMSAKIASARNFALVAWWIKRKFPLKTKEQCDLIAKGIGAHMLGKDAQDPCNTDKNSTPVPPRAYSDEEAHEIFLLDYWPGLSLLEKLIKSGSNMKIVVEEHVDKMWKELLHASFILIFAVICAIVSFVIGLISHETLNFVPVLTMVAAGISLVSLVFSYLRYQASLEMKRHPVHPIMVKKALIERRTNSNHNEDIKINEEE